MSEKKIADLFNTRFNKKMSVEFKQYEEYEILDINNLENLNNLINMIKYKNKKLIPNSYSLKNLKYFEIINKI